MKAIVTVMLKNGVLDPQGEAVKSALARPWVFRGEFCAPGQGDRAGLGRGHRSDPNS
jgi:hypothetical protein